MPKDNKQWIVPGIAAGVVLLAAVSGLMPLMAVQMIFPILIAVTAYISGLLPTILLGVVSAASCLIAGLGPLLPLMVVWNGIACLAGLIPLKNKPKIRSYLWAGAVTLMWGIWIVMMQTLFDGQMIPGIAKAMQDELLSMPEGDMVLLGAYNMGLARLSDPSSVTATQVMGQTMLTLNEAARTELAYSLRASLEEIMPMMMGQGYIYHMTLITALCTLLPDGLRRKRGERGIFPPVTEWHMPRGVGLAIGSFALGYVLPTIAGDGIWNIAGTLFSTIFATAYMLQGCCVMLWIEKKMGMRSIMRFVWVVLVILFAPLLGILMGVFDQTKDIRRLRAKEELRL